MSDTWLVVAGGGTAGHLLPGLSVARALVDGGHDPSTIHFVGAERGPEVDLVPAAGFTVDVLPGRGIQRRLTPANLAAAIDLVRAMFRGVGIIRRRRPAAVVVLGGYASLACGVGAVLCRVPLVLLEQNKKAGAVNRLLRWFATASAVSFAGTDLPKATVTGNPLRAEIRTMAEHPDPVAARQALDLPEGRTVIGVFAGSLADRVLVPAILHTGRVGGVLEAEVGLVEKYLQRHRPYDGRVPQVAPSGEAGARVEIDTGVSEVRHERSGVVSAPVRRVEHRVTERRIGWDLVETHHDASDKRCRTDPAVDPVVDVDRAGERGNRTVELGVTRGVRHRSEAALGDADDRATRSRSDRPVAVVDPGHQFLGVEGLQLATPRLVVWSTQSV